MTTKTRAQQIAESLAKPEVESLVTGKKPKLKMCAPSVSQRK